MNNKATYFEMPNFNTPPDSLVRLGQIIHDYKDPTDVVCPPPADLPRQHLPKVYTNIQKEWQSTKKRLRSYSVGVWAHFLASVLGVGGDVSLLLEREKGEILKFDQLETHLIEPDLEYVRAAMASSEAVRFYQNHPHSPAFMVTGIKIARGAAIEHLRSVKYGVEGSVGADLTAITGAPITLGPQGSLLQNNTTSLSFSGSSDFVFAYRLRRITKGRSLAVSGSKNYIKGAVHDLVYNPISASSRISEMSPKREADLEEMALEAEDFGYELIYADYQMVNVAEDYDEFSDPPTDEVAQVVVKER
ncbi:hypothetical protein BDW02DRAFT_598570 [Decorospora gaudefroyi]|uniref:Uncharacterized protein n=1 Tax=Decorospora gaudefroyi TaxID=184978 RepID=A0A6A5KE70_9PLEO|nr:hypothetical protein BDW02DRAFT_598570 [Decorospora gaudefroyi]